LRNLVTGIIRLSRYKEYFFFVVITTFMGALSADGFFGWKLVGVLVANLLAVAFSFMINDVEDADDDALDPAKVNRNPVSCNQLSIRAGWFSSLGVALLSALVFALLGWLPFLMGIITLILGFLYSWKPIRLKSTPILDMLSHGMMLAGLQFLAAFYAFTPSEFNRWIFPFIFMVGISIYGELFNEVRDLEGDRKAGVHHTANLLGRKITTWLMFGMLSLGIIGGIFTFFVIRLTPIWVVIIIAVLAVSFNIPAFFKARKSQNFIDAQQNFQKPFEIAAAFGLIILLVGPWVLETTNLTGLWTAMINRIGLGGF
jgi:4-hydroxybenzoate polyprenyltransferase